MLLRDVQVHVVILVHVAPPGRLGLGRLRALVGRRGILILTFRLHGDVSASSASYSSAVSAASFIPVAGGEEGVAVVGVSARWPPWPLGGLPLTLPPSVGSGATAPTAARVGLVQRHLGGGVPFEKLSKGLHS